MGVDNELFILKTVYNCFRKFVLARMWIISRWLNDSKFNQSPLIFLTSFGLVPGYKK